MEAKMHWGVFSLKKKWPRPRASTLTHRSFICQPKALRNDFWVTLLQSKDKSEERCNGG